MQPSHSLENSIPFPRGRVTTINSLMCILPNKSGCTCNIIHTYVNMMYLIYDFMSCPGNKILGPSFHM